MVTSDFHLWQLQVFNSGAEGSLVVLVWLDLWEIVFYPTPSLELENSESLVLHSTTTPWWLQVFTSDNFTYLMLVQRITGGILWICPVRYFLFPKLVFELGTCGSLVLHSTTAPWWLLVFTSDNLRYLTLVQRDCLWYCSDTTCKRFSFCPH